MLCVLSYLVVSDSGTPCASLSVGCSRQEHWSGLPFPPPGNLPNPEIEPLSPALQANFLPLSHWGSPCGCYPYFSIHLLISHVAISFGTWETYPESSTGHARFSLWRRAGRPGSPLGAGTRLVGVQAKPLLGLGECTQPLQLPAPEIMRSCSEPWLCRGSLLNLVLTSFIVYSICESWGFY